MLVTELGSLLLLWVGEAFGLQDYALPASLTLIAFDAIRRLIRKIQFPVIWFILNGTALLFIALSLTLGKYMSAEGFGATCAFLLALGFLLGSLGKTPLIQALAEQRQGMAFGPTPTLKRFFRLYTQIWGVFFLIRGSVLLFLATTDQQSHWIGVLLKVSLIAMILLSFKGRALYWLYATRFYR